MADNRCLIYAENLLHRFQSFFGRIGGACDDCKNRECHHNPAKIGEEGMDNSYAILMCDSWEKGLIQTSSGLEISDPEASGEADLEIKQ